MSVSLLGLAGGYAHNTVTHQRWAGTQVPLAIGVRGISGLLPEFSEDAKIGFIAEFRESRLVDVASREQNQGDTDLTDQTDSTDRYSVGSAPCPTSREVFDNSTPIAFGSPSSV